MQSDTRFVWQLKSPSLSADDAVDAALGLDSAKLSYGPYFFDFWKARSHDGQLVLTLTPDGEAYPARRPVLIGHRKHEQAVPRPPAYLRAGERERFEDEFLRVFGRGLFNDVAHLVKLELRLPASCSGTDFR